MSEFNVEDWKLNSRAVVKLNRKNRTFVSVQLFVRFVPCNKHCEFEQYLV